jgi:hypothetical protein
MARHWLVLVRPGCMLLALLACGCKKSVADRGPQIQWQFSADDEIVSTPALGEDGTIYFTSRQSLYALAADGKMKWRYFPGAELGSSPMVGPDGSIYIVDAGCVMHALNRDGWVPRCHPTVGSRRLAVVQRLLRELWAICSWSVISAIPCVPWIRIPA